MKMADILRKLADVIDSADDTDNTASDYDNNGQLDPHERDHAEDDGKFMPPNQQKLELLKKGVGVESEFDDEGDAELDTVKRNAGISPAVVHIASDDEPLE